MVGSSQRLQEAAAKSEAWQRASALVEGDQGETGLGVLLFAQMCRRPGQDYLQGRPHMGFEQMAADDAAIRPAEHRMNMQCLLALGFRDVADQRWDLSLLLD